MIINEDLKKEVARKTALLKKYTDVLTYKIDRITRTCWNNIGIAILSISSFIAYSVDSETLYFKEALIYVSPIFILAILLGYRRLNRQQKLYLEEYRTAVKIMSELVNLTEWSDLRKRYILSVKDYPEVRAMDEFITTTEKVFSPSRHLTNYLFLVKFITVLLLMLQVVFYCFYLWQYIMAN